jgi:hypothetical protein
MILQHVCIEFKAKKTLKKRDLQEQNGGISQSVCHFDGTIL